ncbi:MAG: hypothetical protein LBG27_13885 [Spirochaetaceae bacterium]|nr:hypothetical protein [Spirochaetaceae bacterium]
MIATSFPATFRRDEGAVRRCLHRLEILPGWFPSDILCASLVAPVDGRP